MGTSVITHDRWYYTNKTNDPWPHEWGPVQFARLPAAVRSRGDFWAEELQALAKRSKDARQSRRLLSLAAYFSRKMTIKAICVFRATWFGRSPGKWRGLKSSRIAGSGNEENVRDKWKPHQETWICGAWP